MSKQKQKSFKEESDAEHNQMSMQESDYEKAQDLKMSDADEDAVEQELRTSGHRKSTGFENSYAKEFKTNPYGSYVNPFDLVSRDPSRAYKQIDFNKFRMQGHRDPRGWIPLTKHNATKENFPNSENEYGVSVQTDGFWHIGDRIWAWMPREQYAKIRNMIRLKTQTRTKSVTQEFKKQANKHIRSLGDGAKIYVEEEVMGPG